MKHREWVLEVEAIAERMPAGKIDPLALDKFDHEKEELVEALRVGDAVAIVMEASDMVYYAVKAVLYGSLTVAAAQSILGFCAKAAGVSEDQLIDVLLIKFGLRAVPGNPKRPAVEAAAVRAFLEG